jgi:hypothetical protein
MSANAQLIGFMLAIGVPCLTSLLGVLVSNSRIGDTNNRIADTNNRIADLRAHMDARFDAHDVLFTEKLRRVEEIMDARLTRIEEHLHLR